MVYSLVDKGLDNGALKLIEHWIDSDSHRMSPMCRRCGSRNRQGYIRKGFKILDQFAIVVALQVKKRLTVIILCKQHGMLPHSRNKLIVLE